ncbi:MAG TPA: hypothetical protein VKZ75_01705, partial [Cyclobacteriaceae bacterium]|nr:hypothetical protein [Cyclobacteriaceae bacterium]
KVPLTRLDMVYALFRGDITQSAWCKTYESGKVTIRLNRPVRYHVDGEPCPENDSFSIQIQPSSLSVMVPEDRQNNI